MVFKESQNAFKDKGKRTFFQSFVNKSCNFVVLIEFMSEAISNGFVIKVETTQLLNQTIQKPFIHFFSYQITIKNLNPFPAKLIGRFWKIWEMGGKIEQVSGLGVVGLQPIIEPNTSFTYTSGCPLTTNLGKMSGHYSFTNVQSGENFLVKIPPFELIANNLLN